VFSAYSPHDPILLPAAVIDVLDRFDGRPTEQVLGEVAAELGLELDGALLQRLVDFGILVAVEG
jgi:hypothetical protein